MRALQFAPCVCLLLGFGCAPSQGSQTPSTAPATTTTHAGEAPQSESTPAPTGAPASGQAEEVASVADTPRRESALYLGFARGPIVRIAEDGHIASIGDGRVSAFAQAPDGTVYVVLDGKVHVIAGDVVEPIGGGGPMQFGSVAPRARNDIWAAGVRQVAHFDGTTWTTFGNELFGAELLRDLAFDAEGVLWVMTMNKLFRYVGGAFVETAPMQGSSVFSSFVRHPEGGFDVQHFRGVDRFDGSVWSLVPIDWVERSREGRLAFTSLTHAAYGGGVMAYANRRAEIAIRVPDVQYLGSTSFGRLQLPATEVEAVSVDGRGRPWFATNGGLLLLERYGTPRIDKWWPVHGFAALTRPPVAVLAVGDGPTVLPELVAPVPNIVRGRLGRNYARAQVQICAEPYREDDELTCDMDAQRWTGVADAQGHFEIEGVFPAGYGLLVRARGHWRETYTHCCAPLRAGEPLDLGDVSVGR